MDPIQEFIQRLLSGQLAPNTLPPPDGGLGVPVPGYGFGATPGDVSQVPANQPALGGHQGMLYPTISPNNSAQGVPLQSAAGNSMSPVESGIASIMPSSQLYQAQQQLSPQERAIFNNGPMGGQQENQAMAASSERQANDKLNAMKQQEGAAANKIELVKAQIEASTRQVDALNLDLSRRQAALDKAAGDAGEKAGAAYDKVKQQPGATPPWNEQDRAKAVAKAQQQFYDGPAGKSLQASIDELQPKLHKAYEGLNNIDFTGGIQAEQQQAAATTHYGDYVRSGNSIRLPTNHEGQVYGPPAEAAAKNPPPKTPPAQPQAPAQTPNLGGYSALGSLTGPVASALTYALGHMAPGSQQGAQQPQQNSGSALQSVWDLMKEQAGKQSLVGAKNNTEPLYNMNQFGAGSVPPPQEQSYQIVGNVDPSLGVALQKMAEAGAPMESALAEIRRLLKETKAGRMVEWASLAGQATKYPLILHYLSQNQIQALEQMSKANQNQSGGAGANGSFK